MYYIIETVYVGQSPHEDRYADADYYDITTVQRRANLSNDWSRSAIGEYDSLEDAQEALKTILGSYRDVTETVETWERETHGVVLRWGPYRRSTL